MQNRRIYCFDSFRLDAANRQLRRGDETLSLPAKAFDLLVTLVENNGRLVEKAELFESGLRVSRRNEPSRVMPASAGRVPIADALFSAAVNRLNFRPQS